MKIEILRGPAADAVLADGDFLNHWQALCAACPWATPFQTPAFAGTWYHIYRARYEPIVIIGREDSDTDQSPPRGLLMLATPVQPTRELVVVGSLQAEYQAWVCEPALADTFPKVAIEAAHRAVPGAALKFEYLPPNTPIGWLDSPEMRDAALLRKLHRPLLRFGNGSDIDASLRKSGNKNRLRRMQKLSGGEARLQHITGPDEFERFLDELIPLYDARRLAVNGLAPFMADDLKRAFHVAMMRQPGLLDVSVLRAGDVMLSAQVNVCGKKEVTLGLLAHNPLHAKFSPGKFHIHMTAQALMAAGYEQLDLTPGGDAYKERFANAWDEVHLLTVFASAAQRRKSAVRQRAAAFAKASLKRVKIAPAKAAMVARKLRRSAHPVALACLARRARRWVAGRRDRIVCSIDAASATAHMAIDHDGIRRDSMQDLLAFRAERDGPTHQEFLSAAMTRLESGQHVYTRVEQGRLVHWSWMADEVEKDLAACELPDYPLPPNHALVLDCYTVPAARGHGIATRALRAMARDAAALSGCERIVLAVPTDSPAARRAVEKAGFRPDGMLFDRVLLGRSRLRVERAPAQSPATPAKGAATAAAPKQRAIASTES